MLWSLWRKIFILNPSIIQRKDKSESLTAGSSGYCICLNDSFRMSLRLLEPHLSRSKPSQPGPGLSLWRHLPMSWHITFNVGDVAVALVYLHPLLHRPGHDLLWQLLGVFQQHWVDLWRVVCWAHLGVNQVGFLSPGLLPFAIRPFCGVCILSSRATPLGFDTPHVLKDLALIDCGMGVGGSKVSKSLVRFLTHTYRGSCWFWSWVCASLFLLQSRFCCCHPLPLSSISVCQRVCVCVTIRRCYTAKKGELEGAGCWQAGSAIPVWICIESPAPLLTRTHSVLSCRERDTRRRRISVIYFPSWSLKIPDGRKGGKDCEQFSQWPWQLCDPGSSGWLEIKSPRVAFPLLLQGHL